MRSLHGRRPDDTCHGLGGRVRETGDHHHRRRNWRRRGPQSRLPSVSAGPGRIPGGRWGRRDSFLHLKMPGNQAFHGVYDARVIPAAAEATHTGPGMCSVGDWGWGTRGPRGWTALLSLGSFPCSQHSAKYFFPFKNILSLGMCRRSSG